MSNPIFSSKPLFIMLIFAFSHFPVRRNKRKVSIIHEF